MVGKKIMRKFTVLFCLILNFFIVNVKAFNEIKSSSIVQLSSARKSSDARLLKALLIYCDNERRDNSECRSKIVIKALLDWKDSKETFLLIEEVHNVKDLKNSVLADPYLIQVSMVEKIRIYPLTSNQEVELLCGPQNIMQRREIEDFPKSSKKN